MSTTPRPLYRALSMLTDHYHPTVKGRAPYWRPKAAPCAGDVRLPAWNWTRDDVDPDAELITLDINAAYLAACSSATFAHGALTKTEGYTSDFSDPGYYLVDVHPWQLADQMPSPLGDQPYDDDRVWVAQPTADLLYRLSEAGYWPELRAHEAWTAQTSCRLRKWTDPIRNDRTAALRARAAARLAGDADAYADADADYQAIKLGYSTAVQMMKGPAEGAKTKSPVYRPDWYATVHAQHAASLWRKAWITVPTGHGPAGIGGVDTITWTDYDLRELQMRSAPLVKIDPTGESLGTLKIREDD